MQRRPITLQRRRIQHPYQDLIGRMQALTFQTDDAAMAVQVVHVLREAERGLIAVSFQTAVGSINITLPLSLAEEMAGAVHDLARQMANERRAAKPARHPE